ncbi:helix-turn-helix domain-containing protein [Microbaculum marinum]|uniref:Helix-turn-helix domain-containing protein n=1 Tax=Microbaculum marinum TaxID=1764581 RepID=A0AAW9RPD2_9HYPH
MANDPHKSLGPDDPWLLIRERELAERWKTSRRTLQRWRAGGSGPAYILIGGAVRYRMADVLTFEERMRRAGGAS